MAVTKVWASAELPQLASGFLQNINMMTCQLSVMLQRGSPVEDVGSQEGLTPDRAGGVSPVHQEHKDNAEDGGEQGHPLVVILSRSGVSKITAHYT